MKFREIELTNGKKILLGKNAEQNEELVNKFKGKDNVMLHTEKPGSPFGVIENLNPSKIDMSASGAIVARYSHDWRDNKNDVKVHVFKGKDVYKRKGMKIGTFGVKKYKTIKIKKKEIEKIKDV
ncbi:MAG TPA: NFACT RNA binding domain-containing protein [Candidatus Nanoarchaeia archaeon]|nr:NFACT RNA binding domain-containing protein [Candidatus Nanoarchaeia archaeon]